ncbi:beta-defensin 112 [Pan paniscus]|uniref:beta-defensin 112 n=1 Tax=Pan paniscus TaxID=9597 RepID=UPI001560C640|nr:beta-defensin 112 [Pan paniscus]
MICTLFYTKKSFTMKILLFFCILLFFGVLIPPARSEGHHITFSRWKACTAIGGRCKNLCDDSEFRISYCSRPTTRCCVTECDPTDPNNWIPKDSVGTQEWYPKDSRH